VLHESTLNYSIVKDNSLISLLNKFLQPALQNRNAMNSQRSHILQTFHPSYSQRMGEIRQVTLHGPAGNTKCHGALRTVLPTQRRRT
jgi:hypothetical protein